MTSYQLNDSIKHSKRALHTDFENKYSHWPIFTRNMASHQWRKTPGCSCTPWANADITCAESIHGIGTTFKAHWLALYWLKLTFAYMRFLIPNFWKKTTISTSSALKNIKNEWMFFHDRPWTLLFVQFLAYFSHSPQSR